MSFLYKPKTKNGELIKLPQVFENVLIRNGAWPVEGNANNFWFQIKSKLYNLYGWILFLNMAFIVSCELAYLVQNIKDVLKAAESFCTSMAGLFTVVRTLHFRLAAKKLKKLFILFSQEIWIDRVEQCNRILLPVLVYFILLFVALTLYSIIPIAVFHSTNQTMESTNKGLPYSMIFPYDVQKGIYYFATYISAVHAGYVIISHFYAYDAILLLFITHLCGQFKMLHGDIVRLIPECHAEWQQRYHASTKSFTEGVQSDAEKIKLLQDMYNKRLHEISARHSDLISFCVQLNDLVSFPLLVNVLNSTFLICFCGFQFLVSGTTSWSQFLLFSSFFLSVILQLFNICACGTLLISSSVETAFYLWVCNWEGGQLSKNSPLLLDSENMDAAKLNEKLPLWKQIKYYPAGKDFRNKLRFMIIRSHRPIELNGMKFTVLSLQAFTKILSSSMSYFTLLKTFLDKQN